MFASRFSSLSSENRCFVAWLLPERAHDPDARQRLLEVGGHKGDPLPREAVGAGRRDPERDAADEQHREHREGHERELRVEVEQDRGGAKQRERRGEQRDHAVGDELVERLHVVGQPRDQHPRLVARVEADRERLQMAEHPRPEVRERALPHPVHEVGLQVGGPPVDERGRHEHDQDHGESAGVAVADAVVDRPAREIRRRQRRRGRHHQRGEHQDHPAAVGTQQRQQLAELLRAPALAAQDLPTPPHRPATSRSIGLRLRNTWSGSP